MDQKDRFAECEQVTAIMNIMHSKYNYSPSAASLRLTKATSAEKFYRQPTERTHYYESAIQTPARDCLACRHEQSIPSKHPSSLAQTHASHPRHPPATQDYYPQPPNNQMDNLRNSIRFLEELIERNKREHKTSLSRSEQRVAQLTQELEEKNSRISELERKVTANQLLQQYATASLVGTYVDKDDAEEKDRLNTKIKELTKALERLQAENIALKSPLPQPEKKQEAVAMEMLQQRVRECEIYAREYESMKLLIHKMEMEKDDILKKHEKAVADMNKRQQEEIDALELRVAEVREELLQRDRQIEFKEREIEQTKIASEQTNRTQWERMQELLDQKDEAVDKLESKLNCVQSELNYLKNRYGYILKITRAAQQDVGSTSELEDYCIERVGRHTLSNGKESIMGLNLSPIKRR